MAETLGFNLVFYCESPGWRRYRWACLHAHSRRGGRDNRIYILFHINQTEGFALQGPADLAGRFLRNLEAFSG